MPVFPATLPADFKYNDITANDQGDSHVTALANGRFVVTWTDGSGTSPDADYGLRARVFNADNTPVGASFLVNTTVAGNQGRSEITALSNGNFAVIWTDASDSAQTNTYDIRMQIFSNTGAKVGAETIVNTTNVSDQDYPHITTLQNGTMVATWEDYSYGADTTPGTAEIRAQVLSATGTKIGAEFRVNTVTAGQQSDPIVTGLSDGTFLITFTDFSHSTTDTAGSAILGHRYAANGAAIGGQFLINGHTAESQLLNRVTALADGRYVVAWNDTSLSLDHTTSGIVARIFNNNGTPATGDFLVNTITAGNQERPTLAALKTGGFIAVWQDTSATAGDTSSTAIRAQIFTSTGAKSGAEILVNTITTGAQFEPSVTVLADGRVMVSWTDFSGTAPDTSASAIRGKIIDVRDAAVNLVGSALNDTWVGTRFGDNMLGASGYDSLNGGGGNDTLNGGGGRDTLVGGTGHDIFVINRADDIVREYAGGGTDWVLSGYISLNLNNYANVERARVTGTSALSLTGSAVANKLLGNDAANRIDGGLGNDVMIGGKGNDIFVVDALGDVITELSGGGTDRVESAKISIDLTRYLQTENALLTGNLNLSLSGNDGANVLSGNAAKNALYGRSGNDSLNGGSGDDRLYGGLGKDSLNGGLGADDFIFRSAAEAGNGATGDVISSFTHLQDDIVLTSFMAGGKFLGAAAFGGHANEVRYSISTGVISGDVNGDKIVDWSITLQNKPALTADDFIF